MDSPAAAELRQVLAHYDLGELVDFEKNDRGFVNTAYMLRMLAAGEYKHYFLRKYRRGIAEEELVFEHSLIEHLVAGGSPVARIHHTRSGPSYLRCPDPEDGTASVFYTIFDYLPGEDRFTWVDPILTEQELAASAAVLAHLHIDAGGFTPLGRRMEPKILDLLPVIAETWSSCPARSKGTSNSRAAAMVGVFLAIERSVYEVEMAEQIEKVIAKYDPMMQRVIDEVRPRLEGKKVMLYVGGLRPRRDWISPVGAVCRRGQNRTQCQRRSKDEMAHHRLRFSATTLSPWAGCRAGCQAGRSSHRETGSFPSRGPSRGGRGHPVPEPHGGRREGARVGGSGRICPPGVARRIARHALVARQEVLLPVAPFPFPETLRQLLTPGDTRSLAIGHRWSSNSILSLIVSRSERGEVSGASARS